jgi:hypothetical protein
VTSRAKIRKLRRLDERIVNGVPGWLWSGLNDAQSNERPLHYVGGYVHKPGYCVSEDGGIAERPSNLGAGAYCHACGHTVPVEQTLREK